MERTLFDTDHRLFAESYQKFLAEHVRPFHDTWERQGVVDREVWREAGRLGFLGTEVPEEFGGGGIDDFRFNVVVNEESVRSGCTGLGFALHNDVVLPYLLRYGSAEQQRRWLPGMVSGELITAIAMTEPGAGSDLLGITTRAVRDGDDWILNGTKMFITNGINADLVIVVAQTDPAKAGRGFSLFAVERGMAGFERGRALDKIGQPAQDTAELFFTDVRVPADNLIGREGMAFAYLMQNLPRERLSIAVGAVAAMENSLDTTIDYVRGRSAFGKPLGELQNVRFTLADLSTSATLARLFVDRCVESLNAATLSARDAAMVKMWTTEEVVRVVDRCLQLHGGYGYMREYPIAKAYLDTRVLTIYGGTTEVMKEFIGRSLGLNHTI
ncbi:acyl-CoA dehydrogenase family protein [Nocardia mexicana]|uniref:Alkylation response protein AidB-like acyl-CoA dehydrogenase n=1 Tax=Nocardia mexicana TaxID=279262 RepID=A0A370GMS8_9NOCA|nr:acyl-CoA dehydrogenase family protein [Nocardia mexicana]RDI44947.1 alkylation response protein AidB-like acyl-CoA dehydrogenase [Nocardia mexicana]